MTPAASPRATAYAGLAALFLFAALATRRPELAVVAAPFALLPALGLALARPPEVRVWLTLERPTALEQEELELELVVASERPVERLELLLVPARRARDRLGRARRCRCGSAGRTNGRSTLRLRCVRWGNYELGDVGCGRATGSGCSPGRPARPADAPARLPAPETLRAIVAPVSTRSRSPATRSRARRARARVRRAARVRGGRPRPLDQLAGERPARRARRQRAPPRAERRRHPLPRHVRGRGAGGRSTLDLAVRATATLASRYLDRRDRVGLVSFGGILRWLTPGMGRPALPDPRRPARRRDRLQLRVEGRLRSSRRALPPQALVVALSPLLDDRAVEALADLRARGYDLAIVEVAPAGFATPRESESDQLAYRLWLLRREGDPRPLRAARCRRRDLERRTAAGQRPRGGEGIPQARSARARIVGRRFGLIAAGAGAWFAVSGGGSTSPA